MGAITSSFLFDVESRWRAIMANDYAALTADANLWWSDLTKVMPSGSRRELLTWIVQSAQLEDAGELGGKIAFEDMTMLETDFVARFANSGLKLLKSQFEDLDGNGIRLGTDWIRQVTAQAAYWPQKQIASLLKSTTGLAYDGLTYFHAAHYNNGVDAGNGTYGNLITSKPIDASVSADVALAHLASVYGTIGSVKMPNGVDPRFLRPVGIIANPVLYPRAVQLTDAKFIAATAGSSSNVGGSADVEGMIRSMGYGKVISAPELAGFESNTTYFVVAAPMGVPDNELSGFVYVDREPFSVKFYTGEGGGATGIDAILDRANELEWHMQGRNVAGYGHPYHVFKCTASG